jgi:hypothetical protein
MGILHHMTRWSSHLEGLDTHVEGSNLEEAV